MDHCEKGGESVERSVAAARWKVHDRQTRRPGSREKAESARRMAALVKRIALKEFGEAIPRIRPGPKPT